MNPIRAGIVNQIKDYRWVWSENVSENSLSAGCLPDEEGEGVMRGEVSGDGTNSAGYGQNRAMSKALGGCGTGIGGSKVAQIGAGKIFGSMEFVLKLEGEIWASIHSFRRVAHSVKVYGLDGSVIDEIGFSSHGWRLAKRDVKRLARCEA